MHIAIVGPVAGEDVQAFLNGDELDVPPGYEGAPLMGVLIGELLKRGHRVTAITSDSSLAPRAGHRVLRGPNFTYVATPARRRAWRPNGTLPGRAVDFFAYEIGEIQRAIAAAAPEIVHAHWSYEFALGAFRAGLPTLVTCHDSPWAVLTYVRDAYRLLRYFMARRVFARGRAFTVVSDYLASEVAPYLGKRPTIVPNPVADYVLSARSAPRAASRTRRVGMVCNGWGRLKNPETALRAFAAWHEIEPGAELHVFGHDFGPGERAQQWAERQGVGEGVQFHGKLPHRELVRALDGLDALLHPAREETFGVVVAEAMALGLPVIAGRASGAVPWVLGADELGRSDAGLLIDVNSVQEMAHALSELFGAAYGARSEAGMTRVRQHFSPAAVTQAYEREYDRLQVRRDVAPAQMPGGT